MDISINVGYFGPHISEDKDLIKKLDDIGVSCVWTAEAYGFDAVTPLAYFSALTEKMNIGSGIMQIPARTPAMTAMTAVTLDQMSKGRFRLGLGVSQDNFTSARSVGNFLTKFTSIIATLFIICSIAIVAISRDEFRETQSVLEKEEEENSNLPQIPQSK